jgi:hypothetical protein
MDLNSVYVIPAVVMTLVLLYRLKKITGNLVFNPLLMPVMTFSISLMTVVSLFSSGVITISEYYVLLMLFSLFFVGMFFLKSFIRKSYCINEKNCRIKKIDEQVLYVLFFISLFVSFTYIYMLWSSYGLGDERLFLNKQYRAVSLIKTFISLWVLVLASIIYAQSKKKSTLFILCISVFFTFFVGSKGADKVLRGLTGWAQVENCFLNDFDMVIGNVTYHDGRIFNNRSYRGIVLKNKIHHQGCWYKLDKI